MRCQLLSPIMCICFAVIALMVMTISWWFAIKPTSVKLLGITLNQHLTFKQHIDSISKKCYGILGALARASPCFLPTYLEIYWNLCIHVLHLYVLAWNTPVLFLHRHQKTQLSKLEVIKKIASRIICGLARNAQSTPLLEALDLEALSARDPCI